MVKVLVSGTVGSVTGTSHVASGTVYEMARHEQNCWFNYRVVTYGKASGDWPPSSCTTVSGLEITNGHAQANQRIYTYNATATPGMYQQQTYSISSQQATYGLGSSGIVFADQAGIHERVKRSGDEYYYNYQNLGSYWGDRNGTWGVLGPVFEPIHDLTVIDGTDGGLAATYLIQGILDRLQPGGLVIGSEGFTTSGMPNWRDDLVI